MQAMLVNAFVQTLLLMLDGPTVKRGLDALLDVVEEAVEKSETPVDNAIVLPLIAKLRRELDVPDNDP